MKFQEFIQSQNRLKRLDRLDAEILLAHILGLKNRTELYTSYNNQDIILDTQQTDQLNNLISRREQGEPIAYLVGKKSFWDSEFLVSPDVLIPRPETELLVEQGLSYLETLISESLVSESLDSESPDPREITILELGVGTGAVILSLAQEIQTRLLNSKISNQIKFRWIGIDCSIAALKLAQTNQTYNHIQIPIIWKVSDWFSALSEFQSQIDLIISNPPYIKNHASEISEKLEPHVLKYEPHLALFGGESGLDAYQSIITGAPKYLKPGGAIILEHSDSLEQVKKINNLLLNFEFSSVQMIRDLSNNPRITRAYLDPKLDSKIVRE